MIYVIEDDRGWEDYYRRILKDYAVRYFHDGVAAVAELDEDKPSLIILDLLLTGPTGFAILNELQSYPESAQIPVVVVSSVDVPVEDVEALAKYGVRRVLDKATMTPKELLVAVGELV